MMVSPIRSGYALSRLCSRPASRRGCFGGFSAN